MAKLETILAELIKGQGGRQRARRGLAIAYGFHPAAGNLRIVRRLVWSRPKVEPNPYEDEFMMRTWYAVMEGWRERLVCEGPDVKAKQRIKAGWFSTVCMWQDAAFVDLALLDEPWQARARTWLERREAEPLG
jgi:hypothetical protein